MGYLKNLETGFKKTGAWSGECKVTLKVSHHTAISPSALLLQTHSFSWCIIPFKHLFLRHTRNSVICWSRIFSWCKSRCQGERGVCSRGQYI